MTKWSSEWDYDLESATEINIQWTGISYLQVYDRRQFGWRIIHGNEFKLPEHGMLLLVLLCQGTQVFIMTLFSLSFKSVSWKMHFFFLLTALLFPGIFLAVYCAMVFSTPLLRIVFAGIFIRNLIFWMENSPAAVSSSTLFEFPVQTQETPLVCPKRSFFTKPTIILGNLLPFGCIFLQLPYILNRIWSAHMHYLLAFLLLVFLILMICCSEVTVLLYYFQLCAEDCGWWWRAFWTGGFTSIYVLLYAIPYFFTKLQVTGIRSTFMYFGDTWILALAFFLFRGTIGLFFLASALLLQSTV